MKPGDVVVLVVNGGGYESTGGLFPQVGSCGVLLSAPDQDGDVDVLFDGCPCPVESPDWVVQASWLVKLPPEKQPEKLLEEAA